MKWIGQHIWDFISRFRSTVYIENLETSSEENVLVVDSSGKVTKNTSLGGSDLTITNATDNRVVTSTGGSGLNAESGVTYDGTTFSIGDLSYIDAVELLTISGNSASSQPAITLSNAHTGAVGPALNLVKSATGDDDDQLGKIAFAGNDDGGGTHTWAQIEGYIGDASAGAEEGKLVLSVASHDGEIQPGLIARSGDAEDEVDVTIGSGSTSLTTIAGTLTMGSTAFVNNSGVVQVATQGTIDHDSLANFVANEHIDWTGDVSASSVIHTNNITDLHGAGVSGSANSVLTDDGDGTVTSENNLTWDGDDFLISSSATQKPQVIIHSTTNDN